MIAALLLFGMMGQLSAHARTIPCNEAMLGLVIHPDGGSDTRCAIRDGDYAWVDAPIACSKYQHVVHHPAYSGGPDCSPVNGSMLVACPAIGIYHAAEPDTCEDDMHVVTEAEWQKLLETLQNLSDLVNTKVDQGKPHWAGEPIPASGR